MTSPTTPKSARFRTLQFRLAALTSVILLVLTAIIGTVTVYVQNDGLLRRVDEQLRVSATKALERSQRESEGGSPQAGSPRGERLPGPRFGSLNVRVVDQTVLQAEVVSEAGETIALEADQIAELLAASQVGGQPSTVKLEALGSYRVIAQATAVAGNPEVVVVGQSLKEVERTTRNLVVVFVLTGLLGVAAASIAATLVVRRSLRPLETLRETAAEISETPLTSGSVELPDRVSGREYLPGTEVGDLAESFNQMIDHVEESLVKREASEAKLKQFVADASHELRTPLTTVSGYAEFAERHNDSVPEEVARSLHRIRSEARRMAGMVEDLLLLARLDSAKPLPQGQSNPSEALLEAISDAQVTAPDKLWKAHLSPENQSIMVSMPAPTLRRVIDNLLTNARVHTPQGTTVSVSLQQSSDGRTLIRVEDNGPGVPEDLQKSAFDRFTRGDPARSPNASPTHGRSTGLGLAITDGLVQSYGGSVTLDSVPGRTVFSVYLPTAN